MRKRLCRMQPMNTPSNTTSQEYHVITELGIRSFDSDKQATYCADEFIKSGKCKYVLVARIASFEKAEAMKKSMEAKLKL